MSEAEILERLRRGEADAFQELVSLHQDRILNTCYRFVPDRGEAEDLAQEVFLTAFLSLGGFRGEAKIFTWLHRVAVTKCLDHIRKAKRKRRCGFLHWFGRPGEEAVAEPVCPQPDPEALTQSRERLRLLTEAMDALAENQRAAFTLSKCEGMSTAEIAEVMESTVSAVESLIHRARRNLEKRLREHYENIL